MSAGDEHAVAALARLERSEYDATAVVKSVQRLDAAERRTVARIVADADNGPKLANDIPSDALARTDAQAVIDLDDEFDVAPDRITDIVGRNTVDAQRVRNLLRIEFTGRWSAGQPGSPEQNLAIHIDDHADE